MLEEYRKDILSFVQTYYNNNVNNSLQFASIYRGNEIQIGSAAIDRDDARQVAINIKTLFPLANVNIINSINMPGLVSVTINNPEAIFNERKISLFFQALYNKHTKSNLHFEGREGLKRDSEGNQVSELRIVSPALNEHDAQQVANQLKKLLPPSANVNITISHRVPGQFRAIIINTEEVFQIYLKEMAQRLNKAHPIPNTSYFNYTHYWEHPCGMVIGYQSGIASLYHSNLDDPKYRAQLLGKIYEYHNLLESRYPGIKISIEHHKHGDAYLINNFTYEHYEAVQKTFNQRSLRELGIAFFKAHKEQYNEVKEDLTIDLKEDIGFETVDYTEKDVDSVDSPMQK